MSKEIDCYKIIYELARDSEMSNEDISQVLFIINAYVRDSDLRKEIYLCGERLDKMGMGILNEEN